MIGSLRYVRWAASVLLILPIGWAIASCGNENASGPAGPGEMVVHLDGAASDDGAVLLEIGPGATGVGPARPDLELHYSPVRDRFSVAVFGAVAAGPVVRIQVEDGGNPPDIRVVEVAGENGELRPSTGVYKTRVEPNR